MDAIEELLSRAVDQIIPSRSELESELRAGKKLKVYQGFDPTGEQLHIGHLVGLRKLRQWQNLGHEVIFLVGDFTGMVGDPTGKDKARSVLTHEQVMANARTYKEQAGRVLRFEGDNPVMMKYNGDWLSRLSAVEVAKIASLLSVQQVIERDMFQKRFAKGSDVSVSEFLYPLMQGYDSVVMDIDVEVGGSDQLFNMMTGRDLMHKIKRKNKFVMTTRLLADAHGRKVGKTEGNAVGLMTPPGEMFGAIMSFDDSVLVECFESLTTVPMDQVGETRRRLERGENPMVLKKELAHQIVREIHGEKEADMARGEFEAAFQGGEAPEGLAQVRVSGPVTGSDLVDILVEQKLALSRSQARRLLAQGGISYVGGEKIALESKIVRPATIRVGKRHFLKLS